MARIKMGDPVTHREYAEFDPKHRIPPGHENKAVVNVSFYSAMAYAAWLSRKTGRRFRLPLEEERKEAEATFVGDFSEHPLTGQPDVGIVGRNADGVADLAGVLFDWIARPEDIADRVKLGWEEPAEEPDEEPEAKSQAAVPFDLRLVGEV
jgi:formylglycine-generating enzyme required for sulfatase activity